MEGAALQSFMLTIKEVNEEGNDERECVGVRRRGPDGFVSEGGYTGDDIGDMPLKPKKKQQVMESLEWE